MKKTFAKLHLWLSIPFGLVISIMCITGAILIFEKEITQLTNPTHFYVKQVKEQPIRLEKLIPMVQRQLVDSLVISTVTIPSQNNANYTFNVEGQSRIQIMVDPYSGQIRETVTPQSNNGFFSTVRRLHRWFLFETKRGEFSWGKMITGTSTLLFIFIIISGIIIWIPKSYRMLKNRLSIHWSNGKFRFWYDLHLAGGMYAAIFLLIFCLTGLTWSFGWYRTGFYKLFGVEVVLNQKTDKQPAGNDQKPTHGHHHSERSNNAGNHRNQHKPNGNASKNQEVKQDSGRTARLNHAPQNEQNTNNPYSNTAEYAPKEQLPHHNHESSYKYQIWSSVIELLKLNNPHFNVITVEDGSASVSNNKYSTKAVDRYTFDPQDGKITNIKYYKDSDNSSKLRSFVYSLHVGNWGGLITRILSFIACLIGASLPLTGYYIYIKKLIAKSRNTGKSSGSLH